MKKYQHIIWDWNGTLFDDVELCHNIINRLLIRNKIEKISLQKYRDIFDFPVKKYYQNVGLDFNKTSFEILGKEFMDEYEERKFESSVFNEIKDVLESVRLLGLTQSILSAYHHDSLVKITEHFGIKNYFIGLNGLDNIYAAGKIDIGKEWIKKSGYKKGEVVLIGDTIHDFEVAEAIGTDSILIASGHQSKERLLECGVPVYDDLNSLKRELLKNH
ncbi:MAG: HAD hydrolase-like protein [Ignavibacteriaceae bacterium]